MNKKDWEMYLIYLIINNWKWLKYLLVLSLIFLIIKAFN